MATKLDAKPSATEDALVKDIAQKQKTGGISKAILQTDDRVLARITDGIYRQPASALRELISNAYDADATSVIIQTDAPRFTQISIRDNGNGMDVAGLARLIHHIGGSAKRTAMGSQIGVTSKKDPTRSPQGRRLIGKIGIGLFSVAQLTRHFQIVTKVKGEDYRLVAEVILHTYAEEELAKFKTSKGRQVETGSVTIASVMAEDKDAHGTEIILMDLRTQSRDLLQSKDRWSLVTAKVQDADGEIAALAQPPSYHIGRLNPQDASRIALAAKLPWSDDDKPSEKFHKLYQAVLDEEGITERTPRLELSLDNYLQMLWTLSLAAPIEYIANHPFDLGRDDGLELYELTAKGGRARQIKLSQKETVRKSLKLQAPEIGGAPSFRVVIDDVELRRPIRFTDLPETDQALKNPMCFFGKADPDLSGINERERGGNLSFEAYFLWAPKIVPKENNGLIIRISDASGTPVDNSFAKYQVSELTRLKQLTAEIFVLKGLDPALNIDRESFNYAHPHYQFVMRWVHRSLRQIMTTLKARASETRVVRRKVEARSNEARIMKVVEEEVISLRGRDSDPVRVRFTEDRPKSLAAERRRGTVALRRSEVFGTKKNAKSDGEEHLLEAKMKAVAQILDAHGLLEGMTWDRQEKLLRAIAAVFLVGRK